MTLKAIDDAITPLQRARLELGWKQPRVIAELISLAQQLGIRVARPASLKTMLSRWENGLGQPDAVYRRLFRTIYQADDDQLGFTHRFSDTTMSVAPAFGIETVAYFRNVLDQHIQADHLMGPHHLVEVVRAQATLLDQVLRDARTEIRPQLMTLACRYNEVTGWLYQDAGDGVSAMQYSDRAMDYALALDDPIDTAYLLMRKSNIACDLGSPDRALGLTEAALRESTKVPPRIRVLILTQQARAHAQRRDANACATSLDAAMRQVTHNEADADDVARYCTPGYVGMQAATCWTELRSPDRAIPVFERALATWPAIQRRDQGLCLARLALAYALNGDRASACRIGVRAVETVGSATSARAMHDLRRLRERLAPWRRDAEELNLNLKIKNLVQGAPHR